MSGLLVGGLLGAAVLVAPGRRAPRSPDVRSPRPRRADRPEAGDEALLGARQAERAAALLRAGIAPALVWEHAGGGVEGPAEASPVAVRAVWRLVTATGAPAADALEAAAEGLRADAAARAAVRTALAGARVSARTVSALPLLGLALGAALGAPPWEALGSGPGRLAGAVGGVLLVLGWSWSARLVASAERAAR
ncbi:type II secretion protein F [Kineococcus sp. GCM10028916]|uniref:type II secretion protein F n=1 Tax=Kineococcus sp. GCM10028916 TaxID=3273394 RepID=UPI00362B007F